MVPRIKEVWSAGTGNILKDTVVIDIDIAIASRYDKSASECYGVSACTYKVYALERECIMTLRIEKIPDRRVVPSNRRRDDRRVARLWVDVTDDSDVSFRGHGRSHVVNGIQSAGWLQ